MNCFGEDVSQSLGEFSSQTDIGDPAKNGLAIYDVASQSYTVSGAGTNMWFDKDEFHFVYKRMKGDGSEQVQLTHDQWNDWFPHVSPDGKRIVFLSFPKDVPAEEHPFYRHVYLRSMPVEGGEPRVVAYLYGGQGTIKVPSWSPDGRHVAFVSYTGS